MDFGSEFVYSYSDSEEEEISAEAIEAEDSVPEEVAQTLFSDPARSPGRRTSVPLPPRIPPFPLLPPPPPPPSRLTRPPTSTSGGDSGQGSRTSEAGQKWRRADTNVVMVKFDRLIEPSNMHTGDPIVCSGCQAMLSHLSKISQDGEKKIWTCEFCETANEVEIVPEEIPSKADVTYMLEPALETAAAGDGGASDKTERQESIVVFCIDCSGSMSTVVASNGGRRITRLEGVKRAVCHQLERLEDTNPACRVAVVTFESRVEVIADGKDMRQHVVADDNVLNDKTKLLGVASELPFPSRICDTRKILTDNILRISERGTTALGPGLLLSVGIARQMAMSKVIVCTDGQANRGLGSLNNQDAAYAFYTEVADIAKESGVSVSVLTISGTDCRLVELGRVAELTGGQVNIVDPDTATEDFGNILADAFIATHVTARFFVHRDLYVRGEGERRSEALRDIGNVTQGTEISFEYGVRRKKGKSKTKGTCQDAKDFKGGDDDPDDHSMTVQKPVDQEQSNLPVGHVPFQVGLPVTEEPGNQPIDQKPIEVAKETDNQLVAHEAAEVQVVHEPDTGRLAQTPANQEAASLPIAQEPSCVTGGASVIPDRPTRLPFQVQIRYTDITKRAQAVRVFTETKPVTKDRKVAERKMNIPIIGTHAVQSAADKALNTDYMKARLTDCSYTKMFQRNATEIDNYQSAYDVYEAVSKPVKRSIITAQQAEARSNNSTVMDAEKMMQNMGSDEVRRQRRGQLKDRFARNYFCAKQSSSVQYQVPSTSAPMIPPPPKLLFPLVRHPLPGMDIDNNPGPPPSLRLAPPPIPSPLPVELHDPQRIDDD